MKEAFYFPHDCNATQDPRLTQLLVECGAYGIGLFWIITEVMHSQCNGIGMAQLSHLIRFYGRQGTWDENTLQSVERLFFETGLFFEKDGVAYSKRVINNLKKREELSKKGKENAEKRWRENATPMPTQCNPNAIKERKGKERKEKKEEGRSLKPLTRFIKPTPAEAEAYALSIGFVLDGEKFCDYYEARGWMIGKSAIKNWQACARTWKKRSEDCKPKEKLVL